MEVLSDGMITKETNHLVSVLQIKADQSAGVHIQSLITGAGPSLAWKAPLHSQYDINSICP